MPPATYRVYIDESGDRGLGPTSSRYFLLAAVIVQDTHEPAVRQTRQQVCAALGKPAASVLHWSQNIKSHPERKHVARVLGSLNITLAYVIVDKASLRSGSQGMGDHARLYSYAARRMLERLSWFIRDSGGIGIVTFAHVKNYKYAPFHNYLSSLRADRDCTIDWPAIPGRVRIDAPNRTDLLQWADIAAGVLMAAIRPDPFGAVEYSYLAEIEPLIYRRPPGLITAYGLHVIHGGGGPGCLTGQPWWPSLPR